jgi:hypothetical protein
MITTSAAGKRAAANRRMLDRDYGLSHEQRNTVTPVLRKIVRVRAKSQQNRPRIGKKVSGAVYLPFIGNGEILRQLVPPPEPGVSV